MKIGFAARYDPRDKKTWSGTSYYTYQQLQRFGEVELFQYKLPKLLQEWLTTQKSINRRWFGKQTSVEFLNAYAKYFSRQLRKDLKKRPVDVLFVSASSQLIAYVETDIPIVYMTDATFQQLQGYYTSFSNLAAYNVKQGIALDKKAFEKAAHCMLASDWCQQSAITNYGIQPQKISVVPCGANLDNPPAAIPVAENSADSCRLLFLGVEWERKGGDIALDTFYKLKSKGIAVQLHIIGCVPPHDISGEAGIIHIPFLDKSKEEDFIKLQEIFLQTDFLLLPTRAECAGIVFCEASAYGIPSVTTDTGGVTTYVKNEVNGFALPPEANGETYANVIARLFSDKDEMARLKKSSRQYYEEKLNWNAWGNRFAEIAQSLLNKKAN
jgi:glycosyltransferase involved in cell wall biosynthesis